MDGNLSTFLFVFIGILVIAGWVTSEMISKKATRANKKTSIRVAKLEKENDGLTAAQLKEQERYKRLKEEYEKAREAKDQLRGFEREYKNLVKSYNRYSENISGLKGIISAKKYKSNALSREALDYMSEHFPSDNTLKMMKDESTKAAFKRIKEKMKSE